MLNELGGQLLRPDGVDLLFFSTKFIVVLCLLKRTHTWSLLGQKITFERKSYRDVAVKAGFYRMAVEVCYIPNPVTMKWAENHTVKRADG